MKLHKYDHSNLELDRCPHCAVATPQLSKIHQFVSVSANGVKIKWNVYVCSRCARPIVGGCDQRESDLKLIYPQADEVSDDLPKKAAAFLSQALESLHAPSGAIMLCASSIDAMLKIKGLKGGSLYKRIDQAAEEHLITSEMAAWAHDIRLDANDERHADDDAELPDTNDAQKCVDFVKAFADFMFVLPARVQRGRKTETKAE